MTPDQRARTERLAMENYDKWSKEPKDKGGSITLTAELFYNQAKHFYLVGADQMAESIYKDESVLGLVQALDDLQKQKHGNRKAWAGIWGKCKKCNEYAAWGMNWNSLDPEKDNCPQCNAEKALAAWRGER